MNKILFLIAMAGSIFLSSCSSKPYKVERSIEINTPSEYVFEKVGNNKTRGEWSPWDKIDPEMKKEYEGPNSGVGAKYSWKSENEDVGTGYIECIESNSPSNIKRNLTFTSPWESTSIIEWNFKNKEGSTNVSWSVTGELPGMVALFTDMDEILGANLEDGLSSLKKVCEKNYKVPVEEEDNVATMIDTTIVIEEMQIVKKSPLK